MRVKICGIQNEEELAAAVAAGADAVGFQVGQVYAARNFILPSTARRLAECLPVFVTPVLVTHLTGADAIYEIMEHAGINTVQLTGCAIDEVARLRDRLTGGGKIIYTDYVHDPVDEMKMANLLPLLDAVNLDCYNLAAELVGVDSPNKCHAWAAGAEYVKKAALPVILSGHLAAGNAIQAIKTVKPFGVDACALLRKPEGGLDPKTALDFVWNSKQTFFNP